MTLALALNLARKRRLITPRGSSSISRFCAVLTDGRSSFTGCNSYKTHPLALRFSNYHSKTCIHAEISAIIEAKNYFTKISGTRRDDYVDLSGFKMSIARVLADGSPGRATPCGACREALRWFRINEVEWTESETLSKNGSLHD